MLKGTRLVTLAVVFALLIASIIVGVMWSHDPRVIIAPIVAGVAGCVLASVDRMSGLGNLVIMVTCAQLLTHVLLAVLS